MITGPVYLDYAATTPVDASVAQAMNACLTDARAFGNPASGAHAFGREAEDRVERARLQVATLIGAAADEIIWTSGATEPITWPSSAQRVSTPRRAGIS